MKSLSSFLNEAELDKASTTSLDVNKYMSLEEICKDIIQCSNTSYALTFIDWSKDKYEVAPKVGNFLNTRNEKFGEKGRVRLYVNGNVKKDSYKIVLSNEYTSSKVPSSETVLIQGDSRTIRTNVENVCKIIRMFDDAIKIENDINRLTKSYNAFAENVLDKINTYSKTKFKTLYKEV